MKSNKNNHFLVMIKIILIGAFIAGLIYLLHPTVGQFSMVINGEPVASPLARFAAIPTFFAVILFTCILVVITFFGAGLILFLGACLFVILALFFIAPYAWPILLIIFILIALLSIGDNQKQ